MVEASAGSAELVGARPAVAVELFGARLPLADEYVRLLAEHGERRGLIGPRELPRLWDRHVLNSVAVAELIPAGARVLDVGSGAGLPGVPLSIARPDVRVTMVEPMERRVAWLSEVIDALDLDAEVIRGRAEEPNIRRSLTGADVGTARAVAPLAKLAHWCLPLLRPDGLLLALKGASAEEELARDANAVRAAGGASASVVACGAGVLATPTTVVVIRKEKSARGRDDRRSTRKDR
ncbi:MAG TPA: 16S rRNA (guanine(527)-N(7))-methyltransferase RsmG [Pseudonocardiaceae bacterium]|nr:16S rRNA (guanine(527)-N(7))-methyltransferase RsmG [Pseudonocardiaceae bacterium]